MNKYTYLGTIFRKIKKKFGGNFSFQTVNALSLRHMPSSY